MHYRALPIARKVVLGFPKIHTKHEGVFKVCAQENNEKKTFPNSESKSKGILGIVHSNVCGTMYSRSLSRYVYFVSFIDDFSRKNWIYFLKGKNEVFSKFKEFKDTDEKHTKRKIKSMWSYNGGEFTSEEFSELYKESGIK